MRRTEQSDRIINLVDKTRIEDSYIRGDLKWVLKSSKNG